MRETANPNVCLVTNHEYYFAVADLSIKRATEFSKLYMRHPGYNESLIAQQKA